MKVFVVINGETHEGGMVVSVHRSKENAVIAALAVETHFEDGWEKEDENYWTNGCDFVMINEYEVQE